MFLLFISVVLFKSIMFLKLLDRKFSLNVLNISVTTGQFFWNNYHFTYFFVERSLFCSPRLHLFDQNTVKTVILLLFKITAFFCDAQLYFQHHYCSLQCHMIFRNHNIMLICCSRFYFWLLSMLKTAVLPNIFMETMIHFIFHDSLMIRKFKRTAFSWNNHLQYVFAVTLMRPFFIKVFI